MMRKWIPPMLLALYLTQIVVSFNVVKEVNASYSSNQNAVIALDANEFAQDAPAIVLSSGDFPQYVRESEVYGGTGAGGRFVAHKFRVPQDLVGFEIRWYGYKIGAPTDLTLELYEDVDDSPSPLGTPIETITQPAADVGSAAGWQPDVAFSPTLIANKFYWIVFQTAGGDDANKYMVAARGRKLDETRVLGGNNGYAGVWGYKGTSVLWIRDLADIDKKIYPYQSTFVYWSSTSQDFIAPKDMAFNTIFFYLSDRDYTESTTQLKVIRISDDEVLATGTFNKNLTSGLEWWLPIPLDKNVYCSASESYRIEVPATAFAQEASPAKAGFQGRSRYVLFKLGLMNLAVKNFDIMAISSTGMDAVSDSVWMAVRFGTSLEGTLEFVEVKTAGKGGSADFMASLREDDGTGKAPAGVDLETVTIPAAETPSSGWVTFTGFTTPLSANTYYWIVFKARSGGSYPLCRLVDPYRFMVKISRDGGATWSRAAEGPTEIPFRITTSREIIEQGVEDVPRGQISTTTWVAQSFSTPSDILAKGALVLVGKMNAYEDYDIELTLRDDNGFDSPSSDILATGILPYTKFSGLAVYYVDFDVPYPIKVNSKYWIVIRTIKGGAYYNTVVYRDPVDSFGGTTYKTKVSTDEGTTWTLIGESDMIFALAEYIPFEEPTSYTLASLPQPFVSGSGSISDTFIIIPISDPHGPSGPAHTMDTMGGVLIACRLGLNATSGMVKTAMDSYSYISTYDPATAKVTMTDTTSHLIVLGSLGVNQVAYYYNELRDVNGTRVTPVLFLRDAVGDYLYVQSSGEKYRIGPDAQGRMAEYGVVQLYRDGDRYVMLVYGLGGESTKASAKIVAEFDQWGLTGTAVIVKYYDSNGDGYLDTTEIVETVDLGPSTILFSLYPIQLTSTNPTRSINLTTDMTITAHYEAASPPSNVIIPTYYLSSSQGLDYVRYLVPGATYGNFCKAIEEYLLPMGVRRFYISMEDVYREDFEAWLTACDEYGIENWLELPAWGYVWKYPTEVRGSAHPEAMSYNRTGYPQPDYAVVIDWYDILYPYYRDKLKQMLDWYGQHTSLVGMGSQPLVDYPVYGGQGGAPNYGYNLESFRRFTQTDYYRRDVDSNGYHEDGTKCRLWEHFIEKSATYTIADLIADIDEYHDAAVREHPLHGYVAYLNVANAKLMRALYDFAVSYTAKELTLRNPFDQWVSVETGLLDIPSYTKKVGGGLWYPPNFHVALYRLLGWDGKSISTTNIGHPGDNPYRVPTEEEKLNVYLIGLPVLPHKSRIMEVDWSSDYLTNLTFTEIYRRFGRVLNRMRAYGGWYGETGIVKLLMIGELETGFGPQMLTAVFDVTGLYGEWEELNLTRFEDFSAFNVLLMWGAGRPSPNTLTAEAQERIKSFIYNGGGVVCVTLPSWLADVLGTGTPIGYDHPVMQPFTSGAPTVTEYSYGAGRVLTVPAPTRVEWIERGSDWWVILTNALLYAAKEENLIPAWYYGNGAYITIRPWSPDICYSICGAPGKVLVWLSNRGNITRNMEMHLNSDFYGIDPNGWIAIDVSNWVVAAKGTGTDIEIDATIPPESWMPIYIMNTTSNLQDLYSNIFIKSRTISFGNATYTLQGPYNQTSWLVVNSTITPYSVTTNNTGALPKYTSLFVLNASSTLNGWYHDSINKLLYVKFRPTSIVEIEIIQSTLPDYTLASLPLPFVSESGSVSDTLIIIPISDPHGPSGPAHTMDTMGGVLIACRLGLNAISGIVKTAMDTYSYISTYDYATAKVTMTDTTSHLIVLGSPGVNQVAYYYNELRYANGTNAMPVLFLRDAVGDYLYVQSSGGEYRIGPDDQGRMAEYGVIQLYRDGERYVMLVYGLGGESTKAAAKTVSEFDQWSLTGTAVIVKYYDSDGDGYLDTTEIVETVDLGSSTILSSLYSIQSIHSVPILMLILLPILYYKRKTDSNGPESQGKHRHMRLQPGGHQQVNQEST